MSDTETDKYETGNDSESDEKDEIDTIRKRFKTCLEADSETHQEAREIDKFSYELLQWPDNIQRERSQDDRPCLVMDETNQYINQIKNDQRQNKASIKVRPVDDRADMKVAEMLQGVVRHIEDVSNADIAYSTGFESALRVGFGYWRITTEYADDKSFDQEIKIGRIRNRFSVYLDPDRQEPDGSDAKFGFVTEWVHRDDFKQMYPDADPVDWKDGDKNCPEWVKEDHVLLADYYYIEEEEDELVQLPNGTTAYDSEIPAELKDQAKDFKRRTVHRKKCMMQKVSGKEVLEETEFPSQYIPIIEEVGEEYEIDGKRKVRGIVKGAMDSQRMHNYAISSMVENIALAPKAPWLYAAGQIDGFEKQWEDANRRNVTGLPYHPLNQDGIAVPPPSREPPPGLSNGWTDIMQASRMWVQASMGMYNASVGAPSNEQSGKAIMVRERSGDMSNFHYHDNHSRSVRHTGRIIVDMIPRVYDTKRIVRIIGEDGTPDAVMFDPQSPQPAREVQKNDGSVLMIYNPGIGKYDVTVTTGPSYSTKRQEAADNMTQLVQAAPQLMPLIGDIVIRNMDWPGADQIADRLKIMLPPQIKQAEDKPNPNDLQAQQQQMQQASQALEQKAHALFQKEQQLSQLEQQINQAGQATADERQQLESIKSDLVNLKTQIDAGKQVLDAKKQVLALEARLSNHKLQSVVDDGINQHQGMMDDAVGQVQDSNDQAVEQMELSKLDAITAAVSSLIQEVRQIRQAQVPQPQQPETPEVTQ